MSDFDTLTAMFDRAGVSWRRNDTPIVRDVEDAAISFVVETTGDQPHKGGYSGFFTEFAFGADGQLLAVWAWE